MFYTTSLALVVSLLVAFVPPALHYHYGSQYIQGREAAEAKNHARSVTDLVAANPAMWEFETLRLEALVKVDDGDEKTVIRNALGDDVFVAGNPDIAAPTVTSISPIYDSGVAVGEVIATRSIRGILYKSLMVFAVSFTLAIVTFLALKILPLRLLRQATDRVSFLASHDPLTKLPNRALFNEWLEHSVREIQRGQGVSMAVLYLDLDKFKEVNDFHGHPVGDKLLQRVAERMTGTLRGSDVVARLGGDEFAIIHKYYDQPDSIGKLAERLIAELSKPFAIQGSEIVIGVSIGIALCGDAKDRVGQDLLREADMALYHAKSVGRGTFRHFEEEINERMIARKRMETDLRQAISKNELELHYQPQIDSVTNTINGVEALVRWRRDQSDLVMPDQFIPLAEETGLIVPIGEWVIQEACRQAAKWPQLSIAVNISPVQLRLGNLFETVRNALREENLEPSRLEIEITEGVLLNSTTEVIQTLRSIQALGVKIAMDDFGTGYSSLSYLRRFPFDKIKIDKTFTDDLGTREDSTDIIDAVVRLSRALKMTSIVEGVETNEQAALLRTLGCDQMQGYLVCKPLPIESLNEFLMEMGGIDVPNTIHVEQLIRYTATG